MASKSRSIYQLYIFIVALQKKHKSQLHVLSFPEIWLFVQYFDKHISCVMRARLCETMDGMLVSEMLEIPNGLECLAPWKKEMVVATVQFSSGMCFYICDGVYITY